MCRFCVEHGDGKKWYLEASTYAYDLSSDLERRGYVVDFIGGFDRSRARAVAGLDLAESLPAPVERYVKRRVTASMMRNHFGQPVPFEDCEKIIDITTSVTRIPCVCRRFAGTHDEAYCMVVTTSPADDVLEEGFRDYVDGPDLADFQRLSKPEAHEMLRECERQGLMHSIWTFQTPFAAAICNCDLSSGCMAMRITLDYDTPIMWRGEYVAEADADACTGCKACVEHCPFGAIEYDRSSKRAEVVTERCWGCGICRAVCGANALSLHDRSSVPAVADVW
jgi:Pyruvate/2-oxoacid:ferredoxin oxidoreductase delta subunit